MSKSRPIQISSAPQKPALLYGSSYPPSSHKRRNEKASKTAQKLVVFPQEELNQIPAFEAEGDERWLKDQRRGLARVTSFAIAEHFTLAKILEHLVQYHVLAPKTYGECLYWCYDPQTRERLFSANTPPQYYGRTQSTFIDSRNEIDKSEVFVFDYGVVVLWNFSEDEESLLLAKLKKFAEGKLLIDTVDSEEFHFQYEESTSNQPRIYNDMITLKSTNPLIKLTISHGLAQSVKLSLFEYKMEKTIEGATPLPRMMAKYGTVKMTRTQIMRIVGGLYKLKMDVNLISNILDTPEMFWSEPDLEGLYRAIRTYLEISQRAQLLNSRADVCLVFNLGSFCVANNAD